MCVAEGTADHVTLTNPAPSPLRTLRIGRSIEISVSFRLAHNVAHNFAGRILGDSEILRPPGEILEIESESIGFRQRIEIDIIEPEEVIDRKGAEASHSSGILVPAILFPQLVKGM